MANKNVINSNFINAILYLVVGALLCFFQGEVLNIIFTVIGVLFIVQGILSIVRHDTIGGVISLVLGILVLVFAWKFLEIALIVLGILLIVKSAVTLIELLRRKYKPAIMELVTTGVTLFVGIMLLVNGGGVINWLMIVIGVFFIIDGIFALLAALKA